MKSVHQMAFGAECREEGVRFGLWAPAAKSVDLCVGEQSWPLVPGKDGWFELVSDQAHVGTLYKFCIDGKLRVPDPASRYQPQDVHGPSEVIDPDRFEWQDQNWRGRAWEDRVLYEIHVGTFTEQGTFEAVEQKLDYLVELGVNAIELMPIGDFPGKRNWGYDGVLLFAPDSSYGRPEDLRRLVNAAHHRGVVVLLDVVYNHFGPEGNYLHSYAPHFFTGCHRTPWGDAINFDGPCSRTVRDFFIDNALYWLEEYHLDGLRLDAVHAIVDDHRPDILEELATKVRDQFEGRRIIHLVLENDNNAASLLSRDKEWQPRYYDAQWNDDLHHAVHVLITGEKDGYYADYAENPTRQLGRCLVEGFAYQGERSCYRGGIRRGELSAKLPPSAFVSFLQNHDQVGNRAMGERLVQLAPQQALRAATSVLLLAPSPPMLFMGEEFGACTPFLFFCDFSRDLAAAVTRGRREEFVKFAQFQSAASRETIPDPSIESTFARSKLDWESINSSEHREWLEFYRELLEVRKKKIVPLLGEKVSVDRHFSVLGRGALHVRWKFGEASLELIANLGSEPIPWGQQLSGEKIFALGYSGAKREIPIYSTAWSLDE